jgi:hypothetical protein
MLAAFAQSVCMVAYSALRAARFIFDGMTDWPVAELQVPNVCFWSRTAERQLCEAVADVEAEPTANACRGGSVRANSQYSLWRRHGYRAHL